MSRIVVVVALTVCALAAGSVLSSASTVAGQATGAAAKCKKTKTKKTCKKKRAAAVALKDGDYTYKQGSAGAEPVNTLTISGKGTRITIREKFFSSGESTAGLKCAATVIDFGTHKLARSGDLLTWSSGSGKVVVPAIQEQGAGAGQGPPAVRSTSRRLSSTSTPTS